MYDQCLKVLIIIGLYSAVAGQQNKFDLDCARDSNGASAWWNDPSANQSWHMTPWDDDDFVGRGGAPFAYYGKLNTFEGNSSFRLISPLYSRVLDKNGCFSTFLTILTVGFVGIRLYQKPDYIALEDLIAYSDETKKDYILFEVWDEYIHVKEAPLKHFDSNFQLIFEGIHDKKLICIDIDCVNITQNTDCAGNTGKSTTTTTILYTTTTMSTTTTERTMRENDSPPASPPSNLWPTTTRPTTTQTLQEGNGDTTTDEAMISDEWVDSPYTISWDSPPASPLSNLWSTRTRPTTTRPTTTRPTTTQTLQEGKGGDSRNIQMISIICILGIVSLTLVCVLAVVLARQRGTYRLNDLWANIAGNSSFIGNEAKACDARYSTKDGDDVVIDCNESKQQNCQNTEIVI